MSEEKIKKQKEAYHLFKKGTTIGEIATLMSVYPNIILDYLNPYFQSNELDIQELGSDANIRSISRFFRNLKMEMILMADDIFEDEEDPELRKQWQEEWTKRELDKLMLEEMMEEEWFEEGREEEAEMEGDE